MEPYIGEIKIFAYGRIPKGWAECNGKTLQVSDNRNLFSLIGTQFGGNGSTTFALPDLRGRVPVHFGEGIPQGQAGGSNGSSLTLKNMPLHSHSIQVTDVVAEGYNPTNTIIAQLETDKNFAPKAETDTLLDMATTAIASAGISSPVSNMQPFIGLTFCIALVGLMPSRP